MRSVFLRVVLHITVYTSLFDPSDLSIGYLSDSGSSAVANFSFLVPPETEFLFVAQAVDSGQDGGGAVGCSYSITILFDDCLTAAPSAPSSIPSSTPIIEPSESPTALPTFGPTNVPNCQPIPSIFIDTNETMIGRIRRTQEVSSCDNNKTFPQSIFLTPFLFNEIGPFVNSDDVARCVTVEWDFGTCVANDEVLLQPTVRSVRIQLFTQFHSLKFVV